MFQIMSDVYFIKIEWYLKIPQPVKEAYSTYNFGLEGMQRCFILRGVGLCT